MTSPGGSRHHAHQEVLYSPYGRAYEAASNPQNSSYDANFFDNIAGNVIVTNPEGQSIPWDVFKATTGALSLCGCGPTCTCTGCFQHRGFPTAFQALLDPSTSNGCSDPRTCTACIECSVLLPPPETMPNEMQHVEEWLRQLAASPSPQPSVYPGMFSTTPSPQYSDPSINLDATGDWIYNQFNGAPEYRDGSCQCPSGLCSCASDHRGGSQDCIDCRQHEGLSMPFSGERAARHPSDNHTVVDDQSRFLTPNTGSTPPSSESHSSYRSRASSISDVCMEGQHLEHVSDPSSVHPHERTTVASYFDESDII